jgi:hypothetical protein
MARASSAATRPAIRVLRPEVMLPFQAFTSTGRMEEVFSASGRILLLLPLSFGKILLVLLSPVGRIVVFTVLPPLRKNVSIIDVSSPYRKKKESQKRDSFFLYC